MVLKESFDNGEKPTVRQKTTVLLTNLARSTESPCIVVVVAHGIIELIVNELVRKNCKHSRDMAKVSHYRKMIILNEMNVLSDTYFACLNCLRQLRNRAVKEPMFKPTSADLRTLATLLDVSLPTSGLLTSILVFLCSELVEKLLCHFEKFLEPILSSNMLGPSHQCEANEGS